MPVLPTRDSLGGAPSLRPPGGIASPDTTAVGRGLASVGGQVADLGTVLQATWNEAKKAEADSKYLQFQYDENQRLDEFKRGLKPEEAEGASERFMKGYRERAKVFLDSLGPKLRPVYGDKVVVNADSLLNGEGGALSAERAGQNLFIETTFNNTNNNTLLPRAGDAGKKVDPNLLNSTLADAQAHIASMPISETAKFKLLADTEVGIRKAFGMALPPEMRERLLVDDASGGLAGTMLNVPYDDIAAIVDSADAEIEEQQKLFREELSKDLQVKADDHTLTVEDVDQWRDVMTASEYAKFHRLATDEGEEPNVDPELYMSLVTMSREDPTEALRQADKLYLGRVIGRGIYDRINRAATESLHAPDRNDFINRQLAIVRRPVRNIAGLPPTPEQIAAFDDSIWYFEKWVGDHPDATNDEIRREALAVVSDREKYADLEQRDYLPLPTFAGVANSWLLNSEILDEARKKTAEALQANQISQAEAIRQSQLIQQWAGIVQRNEGKGMTIK